MLNGVHVGIEPVHEESFTVPPVNFFRGAAVASFSWGGVPSPGPSCLGVCTNGMERGLIT